MSPEEMDIRFMRMALAEARKGLGETSPNPAVGAVIVHKGQVLAKGYHKRAGAAHAEVDALQKLGFKAKGCTLYVTLEPCNHQGRTPPCTEAILKAGIARVVVGMTDPNPHVKGGGCEYLSDKGIEVKVGVLSEQCSRLNEAYIKYVVTNRPFVILKSALTLDGWMATKSGHSKWITAERSRRFVGRLRQASDAVMVGVGTVVKDDPLLTARPGTRAGKQPVRLVVDTKLRSPLSSRIFNTVSDSPTMVVVGRRCQAHFKLDRLKKLGVGIIKCPTKRGRIDLDALMNILGDRQIMSLMVEGGATLNHSLITSGLVDKFYIFLAPKLLAGGDGVPMCAGRGPSKIDGSLRLKDIVFRRFGSDILVTGYPEQKVQ